MHIIKTELIDVELSTLMPYPNNPRKNDEAVEYVANSLKEFGLVKNSIVVDENMVLLTGHTTLKAIRKLGWATVPQVTQVSGLTDAQKKAYRLADNKSGEISKWDHDLLLQESLELGDVDLTLFGFDPLPEIKPLHTQEELEAVPEVPKIPITQPGDIWQLGDHKLMCGDSTSAEAVELLMAGDRAALLFTSPPYSDMRTYKGGDMSVDHLIHFISTYRPYTDYQCVNLGLQRVDGEIVSYWDPYIAEARSAGYKLLAWNVWDKCTVGSIGLQKAFFPLRHEWVFVFGTEYYEINKTVEKKPASIIKGNKRRGRRQADGSIKESSVGDASDHLKQQESILAATAELSSIRKEHPAVFPVALPESYIKSMSNAGDIILEPFGGSGTTLIACEQTGRKCRIMELAPEYCDVIIKRWENLTGCKAVKRT